MSKNTVKNSSRTLTKVLITLLIIIYILLFGLVASNERWSDGDEVSYLLFASSIVKDMDLVITNNYENKDYFDHHSHKESPHSSEGRNGELRPLHGILTPMLVSPGYWLSLKAKEILGFKSNRAFLFFPRLNMLTLHIIFSILLIFFLNSLGFSKNISILTVILYLIQLPIVIYSQAIYSDLLQGYFIMTGFLCILLFSKTFKYIWLVIGSIFFGSSIFLHSKLIILTTFAIFSSILYCHFNLEKHPLFKTRNWFKSRLHQKMSISLILPWLILLISNVLTKLYWFGKFNFDGVNPDKMYVVISIIKNPFNYINTSNFSLKTLIIFIIVILTVLAISLLIFFKKRKFFFTYLLLLLFIILASLSYPFHSWLGLWLDSEVGLLYNAPLFVIIFLGLFVWFKKQKYSFLLIIPPIIAYLLIKSRVSWYPGFAPPTRYLLVALPALLPTISWVLWASIKIKGLRWIIGILTSISLILSALVPFVGRMGLPYGKGYNIYWQTILKFLKLENLEKIFFLNFLNPKPYYYIVGYIIFTIIFISSYFLQKRISKINII